MRKWLDKLVNIAKNPAFRPAEIWLIRFVVGAVCVKLGIDVKSVL